MSILLAIDVGNTNIEMGLFELNNPQQYDPVDTFRVATSKLSTTDEVGVLIKSMLQLNNINCNNIKAIIISSVVPPLNHSLSKMSSKYFRTEPIFVHHDMNTGLNYNYIDPEEIGTDRIVNAVAVDQFHKGPAIIVDFGTATTICAISANHEYLGGVIIPGIKISSDALMMRAAKLPKIELNPVSKIIGTSTKENMQSGIYWNTVCGIEGLILRIKKELGFENCKVVATGGFANFVASGTDVFDIIDPNLILKGLKYLYHKNVIMDYHLPEIS